MHAVWQQFGLNKHLKVEEKILVKFQARAKFSFRIKRKLKRLGTLEERTQRTCKQAMNLLTVVKKQNYEDQAVKLLQQFLF